MLFEGRYGLFERLRMPGPEGLPRPTVMLFTGDLAVGMPSRAGARWRCQYEQLFEIWRRLGEDGCSIVWTIASHERHDFHTSNWPFGASGPLRPIPGLVLAHEPRGRIEREIAGWKFLAFGDLGGARPTTDYHSGIARWRSKLAGAGRIVAVSAAETFSSSTMPDCNLEEFCEHITL